VTQKEHAYEYIHSQFLTVQKNLKVQVSSDTILHILFIHALVRDNGHVQNSNSHNVGVASRILLHTHVLAKVVVRIYENGVVLLDRSHGRACGHLLDMGHAIVGIVGAIATAVGMLHTGHAT
jgi:hypothetical protein